MGTVTPIRNDVLPAPFSVYQRKGFIECDPDEADGQIEHTREGEKRHYLININRVVFPGNVTGIEWREVTVQEYLELMR